MWYQYIWRYLVLNKRVYCYWYKLLESYHYSVRLKLKPSPEFLLLLTGESTEVEVGEGTCWREGCGTSIKHVITLYVQLRRLILCSVLATKTKRALMENINHTKHIRARRHSSKGLPNDMWNVCSDKIELKWSRFSICNPGTCLVSPAFLWRHVCHGSCGKKPQAFLLHLMLGHTWNAEGV